MTDRVEVAVIGAGAAGLAAAIALTARGVPYVLLEASHRIGGRAHTEYPPDGAAFDLGCHWMHSASINPFVPIADQYSIRYEKRDGYGPEEGYFRGGQWVSEPALESLEEEFEAAEAVLAQAWSDGLDKSVAEVTERDGEWTSVLDYYTALNTSSDSDQVSIGDMVSYEDTHENWPVVDGYGQLVERWGSGVPVSLNTEVRTIHWGDADVRLETTRGDVQAQRVIITVSLARFVFYQSCLAASRAPSLPCPWATTTISGSGSITGFSRQMYPSAWWSRSITMPRFCSTYAPTDLTVSSGS